MKITGECKERKKSFEIHMKWGKNHSEKLKTFLRQKQEKNWMKSLMTKDIIVVTFFDHFMHDLSLKESLIKCA